MLCMICRQETAAEAERCPHCGAKPWKMPERFLSDEQHKLWYEKEYQPQLARWEASGKKRLPEAEGFAVSGKTLLRYSGTAADAVIPYEVQTIGERAFFSCGTLRSVTMPESVHMFGNEAFAYCDALESVGYASVFPAGSTKQEEDETEIGDFVFADCTALRNAVLAPNLTAIGRGAFHNCRRLSSVRLPRHLRSIGAYAFWGCTSLAEIVIPPDVTFIGEHAFSACFGLRSILLPAGCAVPDDLPEHCAVLHESE